MSVSIGFILHPPSMDENTCTMYCMHGNMRYCIRQQFEYGQSHDHMQEIKDEYPKMAQIVDLANLVCGWRHRREPETNEQFPARRDHACHVRIGKEKKRMVETLHAIRDTIELRPKHAYSKLQITAQEYSRQHRRCEHCSNYTSQLERAIATRVCMKLLYE